MFALAPNSHTHNKSSNEKKIDLKDKYPLFNLLIKFMEWALKIVMLSKSINFIERINRGNFIFQTRIFKEILVAFQNYGIVKKNTIFQLNISKKFLAC